MMVHVPGANSVSVELVMEHIVGDIETKVTGRPELALIAGVGIVVFAR